MPPLTIRETVVCDLCGKDDPTPLVVKSSFRVVRCKSCNLVYMNPRPSPSELTAYYDRETFSHDQVTRAEDAEARDSARERLALIERYQPSRGALLDVGCSAGWFLSVAVEAGWRATGIDVATKAIEYCQDKGFDAHLATLENHDLTAASFAAVTMFDSIEHMPSPLGALREVHTLLADDGLVIITTPNVDGLFPQFTWQMFGRTVGAWEHPSPPAHTYQFSRSTLAAALDRTGFTVIHEETEAIRLDYTAGKLEAALVDVLKGTVKRPSPDDGHEPASLPIADTPPMPSQFLRKAVRGTIRAASWAMVGAISAPAPLIGRGDSLVVIARKR